MVELLVTVVILGILATVAIPMLTVTDHFVCRSAAERVQDLLGHGRSEAVRLQKSVTIHFEHDWNSVKLIEFTGLDPFPTDPQVYEVNLADEHKTNLTLTPISLPGHRVKFTPTGSAVDSTTGAMLDTQAGVVITVGDESTKVSISSFSGVATIME